MPTRKVHIAYIVYVFITYVKQCRVYDIDYACIYIRVSIHDVHIHHAYIIIKYIYDIILTHHHDVYTASRYSIYTSNGLTN